MTALPGGASSSGYPGSPVAPTAGASLERALPSGHAGSSGSASISATGAAYTASAPVSMQRAPDKGASAEACTLRKFAVVGELGRGSFGVVKKVRHRDTGQIFAMKMLEKRFVVDRGLEKQMEREVLIQFKAKHENVVELLWFFEDEFKIYCLLEYADQGQLFTYLRDQDTGVPEPRAAQFFSDTARGVEYLHRLSIAHRDIKPENIMLFTKALRAKVADLGWCVRLTPEAPTRTTFCGTLDYMPPEMILEEPHDASVDLWALGVLLYEMLVASAPFAAKSPLLARNLICEVMYEVPAGSMSQGPRDLISSLLLRDRFARLSLSQVLRHPWVVTLAGSYSACVASADDDHLAATRTVPRDAVRESANEALSLQATRAVSCGDMATPVTQSELLQATRAVPSGTGASVLSPAPSQALAPASPAAALQPVHRAGPTAIDSVEAPADARRPLQQQQPQNEDLELQDVMERATLRPHWMESTPGLPPPAAVNTSASSQAVKKTGVSERSDSFPASFLLASALEKSSRQPDSVQRQRLREELPALVIEVTGQETSGCTPPRSPYILPVSTPPPSPRLHIVDGIVDTELLSHVEDARIELEDLESPLGVGSPALALKAYVIREAEKEFRKDGARRRTAASGPSAKLNASAAATASTAAAFDNPVHMVDRTASTIASTSDDLMSEISEDFLCPKRTADRSGPRAKMRSRRQDGHPLPARQR